MKRVVEKFDKVNFKKNLKRNIKKKIEALDISVSEAAEKIGVTAESLQRWMDEDNLSIPTTNNACRLAIFLDCEVDDLIKP